MKIQLLFVALVLVALFTVVARASVFAQGGQLLPAQSQQQYMRPGKVGPPPASKNELEISPLRPPRQVQTSPSLAPNVTLSQNLSDYLHHHRLPFVNARVFQDGTGTSRSAVLSGQVATEFGKHDAERKVDDWLKTARIAIQNEIEVRPELGQAGGISNQPGELALPLSFRGCWKLVSDRQAGPVQLAPGATSSCLYTEDSGRFCYQQTGNGPYEPIFSSFRIDPRLYRGQRNESSKLLVISTDGQDNATLRLSLHHEDPRGIVFGFGFGSEAIDEAHEFRCRIDASRMLCVDHESGKLSGQPWCDATHDDEFIRVAN